MKLSVIIPVYNAERHINKCLDSVKNQTYSNWEAIIIDDGSSDNSYSLLLNYALSDDRFKVCKQDNQGPGSTRNNAIAKVTGDYIIFIDADDYINVDYFSELNKCIESDQPDVVFIDVLHEKPSGELIRQEFMSRYKSLSRERLIRNQMTGKIPWGGVRKVVRASMLFANSIKYSDNLVGEEALFSFKVLLYAEKISFVEMPCYHYVKHAESQSEKGDDDPWGPVCENLSAYLRANHLIDKYNTTINSFGFTAFIVSIYRISKKHNLICAMKKGKCALLHFKYKYSFDFDKESLEFRTRCFIFFARHNLLLPIVIAAKIKVELNK
ncbi:glycosyltransferase family 2 protein [Cohnella rhizosphaerae]|uniref:Glycosyltransferase family 2 protein n=1 Tax=Cohnella rhizosphaerae TaxID=1457232 RepID=A0A9X4KW48_9BACL|nr:glycosyltransferase family 2 protein [Cohnella rhizosphaerae]MDG0811833.1 glycosyltransferase family 2 protein [Cohnella rhizosphaerae]